MLYVALCQLQSASVSICQEYCAGELSRQNADEANSCTQLHYHLVLQLLSVGD
jgi:hypothetical protein